MIRGRRHTPWHTWRRRILSGVALFTYLAAAVGYPLPAASVGRKDLSQSFPCQGHICGCQSAEECWSGCCCLTPEERWSWARAHGVQPPDYAEKPAANGGWRTVRLRDRDEHLEPACGACCGYDHDDRGSCCSKNHAPATRPSCCAHSGSHGDEHTPVTSDNTRSGGWVLGVRTLHCKGLSLLWVDGGVVVPARGCASRAVYHVLPEQTGLDNDQAVRLRYAPPAPPPKQFSA
jgi:hypothetical protein